jgi:hypothetical protein
MPIVQHRIIEGESRLHKAGNIFGQLAPLLDSPTEPELYPKQAGPHLRIRPKSTASQVVGVVLLLAIMFLAFLVISKT